MSGIKEIKNLKEFSTSLERFEGGHRLCPGCSHSIIVREIMNATDYNIVTGYSTGCLEVCTSIYPFTSWDVSSIHIGFENGSTAIAGAESMYKVLKRKGKLPGGETKPTKFVAFGGDGGTYDIGLQWISGCLERGHDMMYVCLDNEGYMNTGGQRSSSTPIGGATTTSPAGRESYGEKQKKKDIIGIMAASGATYVAQVSPSHWKDMVRKVQKGFECGGPSFLNAVSPCPTEWKFEPHRGMEINELAVESCVFPLFEIENGTKLTITYKPKNKIPVRDYMAAQGRFKHLFTPKNEHIIEQFQKDVDERWEYLLRREEAGV
ncbi:MAG TPA: thiamine pyrophosphate-dependent enzyme [Campylobacterales bacterium]|nr:thiamine pyrophosphate-dependent enzyme [Campylobacterales bacterium]